MHPAMNTPARILRATVENRHKRPEPTPREIERDDRIVAGAQTAFAEHGRHRITLASMALALRIARSTLRHAFCDLDALLAEILHRHMTSLARALGKIPYDDPNVQQKRRAAYFAATRTALGGLNEAHLLLVRDRHLLPEDLFPSVEAHRHSIGLIVAGPLGEQALALLDSPAWDLPSIEAALAALSRQPAKQAQPPAAAAEPTPPPPPPTIPAWKQEILARWPHQAVESAPGDPPDDLTRITQGFFNPQAHAQAPP